MPEPEPAAFVSASSAAASFFWSRSARSARQLVELEGAHGGIIDLQDFDSRFRPAAGSG